MENQRKILPALTTLLDWRGKSEEIKKLELKEIALFLSAIKLEDRKRLYTLLKTSGVERIPFVHLKSDIKLEEIEYLIKKYKTQIFNIHSLKEFPLQDNGIMKYSNIITIENTRYPFLEEELKIFGGTCLDMSHLENSRLTENPSFQHNTEMLKKYPPKCNHIGAIMKKPKLFSSNGIREYIYDSHLLTSLSELDYLKQYPASYFSPIIAIELENTIIEQLTIINYVQKLLNGKT